MRILDNNSSGTNGTFVFPSSAAGYGMWYDPIVGFLSGGLRALGIDVTLAGRLVPLVVTLGCVVYVYALTHMRSQYGLFSGPSTSVMVMGVVVCAAFGWLVYGARVVETWPLLSICVAPPLWFAYVQYGERRERERQRERRERRERERELERRAAMRDTLDAMQANQARSEPSRAKVVDAPTQAPAPEPTHFWGERDRHKVKEE